MIYYIYALICPITKDIRYIGKTKHPKSRYNQHLKDAEKRNKTEKQKWIIKLKSKNMKPLLQIIDKTENEKEARILEEKTVIANINTVFNIHMPGKGSLSVAHYRETGRLTNG